tara:strand:- start:842 stop:1705 length:864 start_codon:yes stop_codon:yes gene_type:complete
MSDEVAVDAAVEEATVEAEAPAPEEEAPAAEPAPDFSAQFAALARKESVFRQKQESAKDKESEISELKSRLEDYESRGSLAKKDPVSFLKKAGVDIKDLLHQDLNGELPVETQLNHRLELLEKHNNELLERLEGEKKTATEQKEEGEWKQFVDQVNNFVENEDKYELIRAGNMQWMVPELMRDFYNKQGKEISAQQAADLVEESLMESLSGYFGSSKLQEKFRGAISVQESPQEDLAEVAVEKPKKARERPKTLTNELASGQTEKSTGLLSREESLERMARMLDGAL